jgi:hypothetical protein
MKFTRLMFVLLAGNYCKAQEQGKTTVQQKQPTAKLTPSNSLAVMIQEVRENSSKYKHPLSKKLINPIKSPSEDDITSLLEIACKKDEKMGVYLLTLIKTLERLSPSDSAYQYFDLLSKFDNKMTLALAGYLSHSDVIRHALEKGVTMQFINLIAEREAGSPLTSVITESGTIVIDVTKKHFDAISVDLTNAFLNEANKWIDSNAFFQDKKFSKNTIESIRSIITEPTRVQTMIEIRPYLAIIAHGFTMERVNAVLKSIAQLVPGQEATIESLKAFATLYQAELVALEAALAAKPRV